MKIVKCSKCGKYIHKAAKCFHCGSTSGFEEIDEVDIHENVASEYVRMEVLLEEKKYDEAITLSYVVMEWMPNLAGVFWLRLLAKNKCSTAMDLIRRGFPCDDSDFCNALNFSTREEHNAYMDIQKIMSEIRKSLKREISDHEYKCKSNTNIMQIKRTMQDEIDARKQKLFSLWSDLQEIEHLLYVFEMDCRLLIKEYQMGLEKAAQIAFSIKSEIYRMEECTEDKLHSFQVRMENVLRQSNSSKNSIENMKEQYPWIEDFSDLVSQQNQKVKFINSELSSLISYERTVQQTLTEIDRIESRHKTALMATDKYDFTDAVDLLGLDVFNQILQNVGVSVNSFISDSFKGEKPSTMVDTI